MHKEIRPVVSSDLNGLKAVLESCELFPAEYLDDMISNYFETSDSKEIWFTFILNQKQVAIGYCVPEKLTDGTYNLLAIGVSKEVQRMGIASQMMAYIEAVLKSLGARILIVETSSDSAQQAARSLYKKLDYTQAATIKDFWNEGEDKIIFWKKLNG